MSAADDRIDTLAGRVADGEAVDWPAAQSGAADAEARELIDQLRAIDHLAILNRSLIDGTLDEAGEHRRWAHLTLLEKVGTGSFGEVYHAWDPTLHRDVALKLLHPELSVASLGRETMREARLLARVRHPNSSPRSTGPIRPTGGSASGWSSSAERAEWAPDGSQLAVTREVNGRARLEFAIHTLLYETAGWLDSPRFTTDGRYLAVVEHAVRNDDSGAVVIVDLHAPNRRGRVLSAGWVSLHGLAWNAVTHEFWFGGARSGLSRSIQAVDLAGRTRTVTQLPKPVTIRDISRDGRVLFTIDTERAAISVATDDVAERDLSWLDWSLARDVSDDGRFLLFNESGEAGGDRYGVYVRSLDGRDAVRLGSGSSLALAPDGRRALVRDNAPPQLNLLPVGPGDAVSLPRADLVYEPWGGWFPDNRRIVFAAARPGHGTQLFVQRTDGGVPVCVTPGLEGVALTTARAVAPDGARIVAVGADDRPLLVTIGGAAPQAIATLQRGDVPVRWTRDGRGVLVYRRGEMPLHLTRVNLADGSRSVVRELLPPDPSSVVDVIRVVATSDARVIAYSYTREQSELFELSGASIR